MERERYEELTALKTLSLDKISQTDQVLKNTSLGNSTNSECVQDPEISAYGISLPPSESQEQHGNQEHPRNDRKTVTRAQSMVQGAGSEDFEASSLTESKAGIGNSLSQPTVPVAHLNSIEKKQGPKSGYQTYKKLPGALDLGREFEKIMCAYYTLMLVLSDQVDDFQMSSNKADDGKFDDVGFTVRFSNGTSRRYMFQLKHKENKKILVSDLNSRYTKNGFGLKKYIDSLSEMEFNEETVCILSTNSRMKTEKTVKPCDAITVEKCTQIEFKDVLVNSTQNSRNGIYEIKAENLKHRFLFFTSQMDVEQTEEKINALLKSLLQSDIYGDFINFMRHWWSGKFILTKRDVISKICELALSPYLTTLSDKKCNDKADNLTQAMMCFPITVIERCKENVVKDIWKIEKSWINEEFEKAKSKYGLKEDQQNTTLWYLGKLPLIVRVKGSKKETIKCVMNLLHESLEDKKIIMIGEGTRNYSQGWDTLKDLSDLIRRCEGKKFCSDILQQFKVSLQETEIITLEDLVTIDGDVPKLIGTTELLQMTQQDSLRVGNQKIQEKLSETHIPRNVSPVFVKKEEIFNCYKSSPDTILVVNCDQSFADTLSKDKDVNLGELSEYLGRTSDKEGSNLILKSTNSKCTNREFERICKESAKSNVYLLQQFKDEYCILVLRKGGNLNSGDPNMENLVEESEIFKIYNINLHVFCAPPGMGKSTLMKALHNSCPHLSVYVSLIDYNSFLEEKPDSETIFWRFFQTEGAGNDLCRKLLKHFWKKQRLYMFLDGLDEVNSRHIERILSFIKHFSSKGGNIWLSARENLREKICKTLNVVPVDIKALDTREQKTYIHRKLKDEYQEEELEKILGAVFKSADLNSQKLLGIPLQLHIITEIFLQDRQVYENLDKKDPFVLTQMFKIYFEGKITFTIGKVVSKNQEQLGCPHKTVLPSYELPALKTCLHKEDFEKLKVNMGDVSDFLNEIKKEGDKNGIIRSVNDNDETVFEHQTYAEYFTCIWLKKKSKKLKKLGNRIFSKDYENLRLIFNVILAENNPLHLAVIHRDGKSFKNRLRDHSYSECDKGDRTVFHLAFSSGQKYPPHVVTKQKYLLELKTLKREEDYYVEMIQTLLEDGRIPDQKDELFGFDCINYALQSGCLYPIEEILRTKLLTFDKLEEPLKKYFDEMALAYCSAQFGYPNLLSELVKSDKVSGEKESLLEIAMQGCDGDECARPRDGNIAVVEILIKNDAFPTTKMDKMLQEACEKKLFDMLEILTENRAKCINGNTMLHHLVERCPETYSDEIVKAMEKFEIDVNAPNNKGVTALHKAAESADLKIVEALMASGADPNVLDGDGRNALHHASFNFRKEVLELFLNKGLPVDLPDKNGATALHLASEKLKPENIKLLLANGISLNLVDNGKNNALHYASKSKTLNPHVINVLVEKGLSVNAQNQDGQTPLHLACEGNTLGNVETLLKHNPDVNLDDKNGNSLFNYILKSSAHRCKIILELLKSHGFDFNRRNKDGLAPIHFAYKEGDFATANFLIRIGAIDDLNATFKKEGSLLHWACRQNNYTRAIELLERGADPNIVDDNNRNALFYCFCRHYRPDLVHAMLKHGLNIKTRYQIGQQLLHFACVHCDTHTIRELCEKSFDVNTLDDDQRSALIIILKSLPEIEKSLKTRLEDSYNSNINTDHEHNLDAVRFGCLKCYYKLVKCLMEVKEDTSFEDLLRQKLSMFIQNHKILDIFLRDVLSTTPANNAIDVVGRFMIFEQINYLRENRLKINNIPVYNQTELDYCSEWEQDYPEISHLLNMF